MTEIQDIFREYSEEYIKNKIVSLKQKKVINAVINCRTEKLGRRKHRCQECGYEQYSYCSCRNRHCPKCQTFVKEKWINARKGELLNTQYFHVVFTLPEQLKMIVKANEENMLNILFKAVSETLIELSADKEHLGGKIGAMLVLHTWDQKLMYHPHIHCVIPGGGLEYKNNWISFKKDFFIHVNILSKVFRGKFLYYFEQLYKKTRLVFSKDDEYLYDSTYFAEFKNRLYYKKFYSYSKAAFSGPDAVIEYLGRYTHRVAISNNRIVKVENGYITFKWYDRDNEGKEKTLTITAQEFIRRFLLHVLPTGFMKIRYIGILSNRNKKTKLQICKIATRTLKNTSEFIKLTTDQLLSKITNGRIFICPQCGSNSMRLADVSKPLLDSS